MKNIAFIVLTIAVWVMTYYLVDNGLLKCVFCLAPLPLLFKSINNLYTDYKEKNPQ